MHGSHHELQHHERHRRRNQRRHRRRRELHVAVLPGDAVNTDVPHTVNGEVRDPVRRKSGGAAGDARSEGGPCGGALGSDQKERAGRAGEPTRPAVAMRLRPRA